MREIKREVRDEGLKPAWNLYTNRMIANLTCLRITWHGGTAKQQTVERASAREVSHVC
jgi:hypothetical protein